MVKLVQIGLGGWGRNWAEEVLPTVPGIEMVGFVDADPAMRKLAATKLKLKDAQLFASLDAAVTAAQAQAALVVVPLAAHATVTRDVLAHGLHALVEKPFTETLGEAKALVEQAHAAGLKLMVSQNYRHFPTPLTFRRLVTEGELGHVASIAVDFWKMFDEHYRYFFLAEPLLSDMAIHHFDLMRFILDDEPVAVSTMSWSEPETPYEGRPAAAALIRFAKGVVVSYRGTWISRGPDTVWGADWRIDGSKAAALGTFRGNAGDRRGEDRVTLYSTAESSTPATLDAAPFTDRAGALGRVSRLGPNGPGEAGAEHGRGQPLEPGADARRHPVGGRGRPARQHRRDHGPGGSA